MGSWDADREWSVCACGVDPRGTLRGERGPASALGVQSLGRSDPVSMAIEAQMPP
jgi:hypothetical protein